MTSKIDFRDMTAALYRAVSAPPAQRVYEFTWQSPRENRRGRGVNFFTLVHENGQWRIMSIVWDNERPGLSLPPEVYSPRAAS